MEPVLQRLRLKRILPVIMQCRGGSLLDIGCGPDYRLLKSVEPIMGQAVGIDQNVSDDKRGKIRLLGMTVEDALPFAEKEFDVVTMLAVLEHLSTPTSVMHEIRRVLRPGGKVVLTVPSRAAKPVLEFLAFRLGIVSSVQIADHKKYFNKKDLVALFTETGFIIENHSYFQAGMNNFCVGVRGQ